MGNSENDETVEFLNMETRIVNANANSTESVLTAFANKLASS